MMLSCKFQENCDGCCQWVVDNILPRILEKVPKAEMVCCSLSGIFSDLITCCVCLSDRTEAKKYRKIGRFGFVSVYGILLQYLVY